MSDKYIPSVKTPEAETQQALRNKLREANKTIKELKKELFEMANSTRVTEIMLRRELLDRDEIIYELRKRGGEAEARQK